MSYIDERRIIGRLDGEIEATRGAEGDWVSPFASPSGLCALQLSVLEGRHSPVLPIAWVTPWVLVANPFSYAPVSSGQFQVMAGVRTLVFRSSVIPSEADEVFEGGGVPVWGLRVYLLKSVTRARFVYWQYE